MNLWMKLNENNAAFFFLSPSAIKRQERCRFPAAARFNFNLCGKKAKKERIEDAAWRNLNLGIDSNSRTVWMKRIKAAIEPKINLMKSMQLKPAEFKLMNLFAGLIAAALAAFFSHSNPFSWLFNWCRNWKGGNFAAKSLSFCESFYLLSVNWSKLKLQQKLL